MSDGREPIWPKVWVLLALLALVVWLAYALDW
jgi:hypothetical protein